MIPALAAHLWQSTWFAGAAWVAVLALRANRAQVRYRIWFAASAKFLVPFSWLVALGRLAPHPAAVPTAGAGWMDAFQEFSQPLLPAAGPGAAVAASAGSHAYLEGAAVCLWACGFAAVAICWLRRWRRVHLLRQSARPAALPNMLAIPVPAMTAAGVLEPGIFGLWRPVLLLPEGIAERLSAAQLEAILAHEACHVRHRDNLISAIHMAVQAVFWFHPLTWWIGARLVDERERACDEEVLRLGCKPGVYAESILAVCKLYLSSPLACVSGVTGSDLKSRIESILRHRAARGLSLGKKLALGAAGGAALLLPVAIGVWHVPAMRAQAASGWEAKAGGKMAFDVASVKLSTADFASPGYALNAGESYRPNGGHFRANFALTAYLQFAYKIWPNEDQTREVRAHLPAWAFTDRYDVDARAPSANPTKDQTRLMMQSLLAERFKLRTHFETREVPVMLLTLAQSGKPGPKLIPHAEGPPCDKPGLSPGAGLTGFPPGCGSLAVLRKSAGLLMIAGYRDAPMDTVANSLAVLELGRTLVDRTGLPGVYDYTIEWAPEPHAASSPDAPPSEPSGPGAVQALRDQLGLKVESARGPVRILVIDHVERPTEN